MRKLSGVRCDGLEHGRPEANGVLERVKSFEHRQRRVASRAPEARDQ
jgi:hypothetical protein